MFTDLVIFRNGSCMGFTSQQEIACLHGTVILFGSQLCIDPWVLALQGKGALQLAGWEMPSPLFWARLFYTPNPPPLTTGLLNYCVCKYYKGRKLSNATCQVLPVRAVAHRICLEGGNTLRVCIGSNKTKQTALVSPNRQCTSAVNLTHVMFARPTFMLLEQWFQTISGVFKNLQDYSKIQFSFRTKKKRKSLVYTNLKLIPKLNIQKSYYSKHIF